MAGKNKLRYLCYHCDDKFISWQQRDSHVKIDHAPPKVTTETASMKIESRTLLGGRRIKVGDVIWLGRKVVITKTEKTEGSVDVEVEVAITKNWWSEEEIS